MSYKANSALSRLLPLLACFLSSAWEKGIQRASANSEVVRYSTTAVNSWYQDDEPAYAPPCAHSPYHDFPVVPCINKGICNSADVSRKDVGNGTELMAMGNTDISNESDVERALRCIAAGYYSI